MNTPKMRYEVRFNPSKLCVVGSTPEACFEVIQTPHDVAIASFRLAGFHNWRDGDTYPSGPEGANMAADDKCAEMNAGLAKLGMLDEAGTPERVAKWGDFTQPDPAKQPRKLDPESFAASPEPKAGQVWVDDGGGQAPASVYVLTYWEDSWQPINLCGDGFWGPRRKTATAAVRGLTFAAPTVADYYQRELLARVAELEAERDDWKRQLEEFATSFRIYSEEAEAKIAAAREQGAKAAREERFVAVHYHNYPSGLGWRVIDQKTSEVVFCATWLEHDARAEAARLNAAEKGNDHASPPKEGE